MFFRHLFVFASIIICYLLQVSVFPGIPYLGVTPNLLLSFTICYGLLRGRNAGMVCGLLSGLLWDILSGGTLGFYTLLLVVIGYVVGMLSATLSPEDAKFPFLLVLISDIIFNCGVYFVWFLFRRQFDFEYYFMNIIMPETVITSLVTLIVFPIAYKVNHRLVKYEKRRTIKFG